VVGQGLRPAYSADFACPGGRQGDGASRSTVSNRSDFATATLHSASKVSPAVDLGRRSGFVSDSGFGLSL
jgi:hypothetical protein